MSTKTLNPEKIPIRPPHFTCRLASFAEILPLRHAILRPGLPIETAHFEGDHDPATRHFGAFQNPQEISRTQNQADIQNICCASYMQRPLENEPAWQLRGMATHAQFQRLGVGAALLKSAENHLLAEFSIRLFWCNARIAAVPFYEKAEWKIVSDVFDVPTVGPHYRMMRSV